MIKYLGMGHKQPAPLLLAAVAGPAVDRLADLVRRDYVKHYRVIDSTVQDFCQDYRGEKFHALLCDPPYHLTSTTKRFGGANAAPAKFGKDGAFSRASRGFMGQQWDGGDVAFDPETWAALGEHLYPGAFGMAFASSRGWHRLAVAIEDAGFIIHPSIFLWTYGSGFPKATRIGVCDCAERREPGTQKAWQGHSMSDVRDNEIRSAGVAEENSGDSDLLQGVLLEGQSSGRESGGSSTANISAGAGSTDGGVANKEGASGGKQPGMEGRGNLPTQTRELPIGEVREKSTGISANGPQGRLHNGTSASDGTVDRETAEQDGSSSSRRSQSLEQSAVKPRIVARQQKSQDDGTRRVCDRCGKPIATAGAWDGHRYGLQALKPAAEPIIVFQKPYEGRPVDCITATGAGALWIDGARIGESSSPRKDPRNGNLVNAHMEMRPWMKERIEQGLPLKGDFDGDLGRWPANLALIHDPRCNGTCVPECAVRRFGEQSGMRFAGGSRSGLEPAPKTKNAYGHYDNNISWQSYEDDGTAARFFHNADWSHEVAEQIANADPVRYEAKASVDERSRGLDKPCPHPTMKPLSLAEWLARLLLPPAAYGPRRLLVPFSGSGSEMIGALLAGWEQIVGIEMTMEYAQIARARLAYYADPLRTMRVAPEVPQPPAVQTAFAFAAP